MRVLARGLSKECLSATSQKACTMCKSSAGLCDGSNCVEGEGGAMGAKGIWQGAEAVRVRWAVAGDWRGEEAAVYASSSMGRPFLLVSSSAVVRVLGDRQLRAQCGCESRSSKRPDRIARSLDAGPRFS
jgi:hypothetical protein